MFCITGEIKEVIKMQSVRYSWYTIFLKQWMPAAVALCFSYLSTACHYLIFFVKK